LQYDEGFPALQKWNKRLKKVYGARFIMAAYCREFGYYMKIYNEHIKAT